MHIAMGNTLALIDWQDFRQFIGDFIGNGVFWLVIGFLSVIVALSAFAAEATLVMHTSPRRRSSARWLLDHPESTIPKAPVEAMMK